MRNEDRYKVGMRSEYKYLWLEYEVGMRRTRLGEKGQCWDDKEKVGMRIRMLV